MIYVKNKLVWQKSEQRVKKMPSSIAPLGISIIEKRALEYIIKTGSDVARTRAKILLELAIGKRCSKN
ncbi:hypothetical protein NIES4071_105750 (plasmid) [Calothrix sp. NIES-4071]|nr:hypothetical protein NIES4071_105750 [Calothrix sp. NIES-4071]BAZ64993.1 hypothetical protein NIES4105_107260 [Calothrix sp. NIES-4105]